MIRNAEAKDEVELFGLVASFPTPTRIDQGQFKQQLSEKLFDPLSCVLVAENDGELIGYVSGHRHAAFYASGEVAWVDEIFVCEASRGSGVGTELMRYFEAWASSFSCQLVGLATAGAREFYERIGYESKAGYFKKYLGPGA